MSHISVSGRFLDKDVYVIVNKGAWPYAATGRATEQLVRIEEMAVARATR